MSKIDFSVVVPVYKSVTTLFPLFTGIKEVMEELGNSFEVVFVEDNGSKESWSKLLDLKKQFNDKITLIKLGKNFGQNGATLCGIDEARGDMIITIDDDLQIHPSELKRLIIHQKEKKSDVVYGIYNVKDASWVRNFGSTLIKKLFRKTEGGSNVGSSLRLINANIVGYLKHHSQDHLFINQVISWYTSDISFLEVNRNPRYEGKSGYSLLQLFLIGFRLLFYYTSFPLKVMIGLGIISSLGSLGMSIYYITQYYRFGQGLGFMFVIVIAIALILASISVLGIYINRMYESRVKKPHYAIKVKL